MSALAVDPDALIDASRGLGPRDALFLRRILDEGLRKYQERLAAIDFVDLGRVLDAGCGFGQWTLALAQTSGHVIGLDSDATRIRAAARLARAQGNVEFQVASLEALPFPDGCFDAVFCFSAIYYTDVRRSVSEIARVLRPGGKVYICSNGVGWYLYNIIRQPNPSPDFSPRAYGLRALWDSARYRLFGIAPSRQGSVITSRRWLEGVLVRNAVQVVACGGEGTVHLRADAPIPKRFFRTDYLGLECVSEWVGVKQGRAS